MLPEGSADRNLDENVGHRQRESRQDLAAVESIAFDQYFRDPICSVDGNGASPGIALPIPVR